jgi:hypothetical protein
MVEALRCLGNEKALPGESNVIFRARLERERNVLQYDWKACNRDAVDALKGIENLGVELESIDPNGILPEEWHAYRMLLDNEKMLIEVVNADMPTDPASIDRIREVAGQLEGMVTAVSAGIKNFNYVIDKYSK